MSPNYSKDPLSLVLADNELPRSSDELIDSEDELSSGDNFRRSSEESLDESLEGFSGLSSERNIRARRRRLSLAEADEALSLPGEEEDSFLVRRLSLPLALEIEATISPDPEEDDNFRATRRLSEPDELVLDELVSDNLRRSTSEEASDETDSELDPEDDNSRRWSEELPVDSIEDEDDSLRRLDDLVGLVTALAAWRSCCWLLETTASTPEVVTNKKRANVLFIFIFE